MAKKHIIWNHEAECMDRGQLRELQEAKLRRTVQRMYENVPLYRSRMQEKGIEPGDIRGLDDLRHLPFIDKPDLRDEFPCGLFSAPKSEIVRIHGSSGTTGKPVLAGYTQSDIDLWSECMARTLTACGTTKEDIVQIAYGYGLFTGGLGAHQGASLIGAMTVPMSSGNTARQIMMMNELRASILCCTPSYALHLGETMEEMGLKPGDIPLRAAALGAEPWSEEMRSRIEALLGIEAIDIYGLTEICGPGVSFECLEKQGMHINEDYFIAEIIDPDTLEPLPVGEKGELVFSSVGKEGMPLLRYRTHDICRLTDEKCECGRTFMRMMRITGRSDDMVVIRGVNVFPSQIESVLVGIPGVAPHYLLVVDRVGSSDTLEIRVEVTEEMFSDTISSMQALSRLIAERVKSILGVAAKIVLVEPKTLPRSEGKAKRVQDNRKI
ncbi:MAG: phenylacetate--CoA ligase [Eubacteriales bacterium]|nr:phenylacetate--CoA ligase [Eubacteriales bacterium]